MERQRAKFPWENKTYKLKSSKGSLNNDDDNGNKNGGKAIGLDWQNNNFARVSHLFVYSLAFVAQLQHEFFISCVLFKEVGEHNTNTVLSDSPTEDFSNI